MHPTAIAAPPPAVDPGANADVTAAAAADAKFWIRLVKAHVEGSSGGVRRKSSLESLASLQMGMHSSSLLAGRTVHQQHSMLQELEELAEHFDQTDRGVASLFHLFDSDRDGSITHEEFCRGLQSQNLLHLEVDGGASFKELVSHVDSDHNQEISLGEFASCLACLRLARLHVLEKSMSTLGAKSELHIIDYDAQQLRMQLPVKSNKRLAFFFNYNDMKRLETRWVHVIGRDDLTLLRLAVKYKLHPMAVLDSMQLRAKPPTCVLYGRDFFISCPQIRLTKEALRRLQQHRQKQSAAAIELESAGYDSELNVEYDLTLSAPPVHVECEQAPTGLFYMREMEVLITMEQTWIKLVRKKHEGRDSSKSASRQCRRCWWQWFGHCKVHCCGGRASTLKRHTASANRVATEQPDQSTSEELRSTSVTPSHSRRLFASALESTKNDSTERPKRRKSTFVRSQKAASAYENVCQMHGDHSLLASTLRNFKRKFTMLRRAGIERLLHTILSGIVDNIRPIVECYHVELEWYRAMLAEQGANFDKAHVAALLQVRRELTRLEHTLHPMKKVIDLLLEDRTAFEDPTFFRDVDDAASAILIELTGCREMVDEISEGFQRHHDRRMNDVLYLLTLVTTCIVPVQLLTGVFGMNFASETAPLGMQDPILRWEWGYVFFWLLSLASMAAMSILFKYLL
eukprot:g3067.t1